MQLFLFALFLLVASEIEVSHWHGLEAFGKRTIPPKDWHRAQRAPSTHAITFIVALKQQNMDKLEVEYWDRTDPDSPNYQQWFTIEEIRSIVSPPKSIHDSVVAWLKDNRAKNIISYGDAIEATSTVADLETMLRTEFWVYKHAKGDSVVGLWGDYHVPADIHEHIEMFAGINTFPPHINRVKTQAIKKRGIFDDDTYVVPQTTYQMYKIPNGTQCTHGSSQGVMEWEQQFFSPSDLTGFGQNMAVANITNPIVVGINTPGEPGTEAELDIQWIAATGIGCQNWFWIEAGTTWLYGFATHFMNTPNVPNVSSMSYGWSETDQCEDGIGGAECSQLGINSQQYVSRVNAEFIKIGLRGVTLFASSGDSGVYGRTDEFCEGSHFNPAFPAASPYVTAVGATEIRDAITSLPNPPPVCQSAEFWWCASGGNEQAVGWLTSGFASGGGFSVYSPAQSYQKNVVQNFLNSSIGKQTPTSYFNVNGRAFPDVAALGSRILIWSGGANSAVGGTSASSPMFAGLFNLLNDYAFGRTGKPLGPANPLLYKMFAEHPAAFTDITVGNNRCTETGCGLLDGCVGFYCAPGWDPVSGLGSPVYTEMLKYLQSMFDKRMGLSK